MKRIYIFLQISCLGLLMIFSSCETTDLDITEDPNALGSNEASTDLFVNSIQRDYGRLIAEIEDEAAEAARINNYTEGSYQGHFGGPTNFDTQWQDAYQGILQDIRAMGPLARAADQAYHIGMGQVIEAYVITALVDLFGDVPYREALDARNNLNPGTSTGAEIYSDAMALLDSAITNFKRDDVVSEPALDLFYGGDWGNWVKAANSIKMKLMVASRRAPSGAVGSTAEFDAIITSGEFISKSSEDFAFPWGNSVNNPDSRHPRYTLHYTPSGVASGYMSNWLMDYMYNDKRNNGNALFNTGDPRMRYYFYRQSDAISTNPNDIMCIIEGDAPNQLGDPTYCVINGNPIFDGSDPLHGPDIGYWGRAHGNNRGGPPDTQRRTAYGVYPVGGFFDDSSFKVIASVSLGAGGAGITPMMMASWVDFMRAEMALAGGDATGAGTFITDGITKSIAKVRTFGSLDPSADLLRAPEAGDDALYVAEVAALWGALTNDNDRWDMLGNEYFVTLFGNGLDGYNYYRRTGRPSTLQRHFLGGEGQFFRSFQYPSFFVGRNSSTDQKPDVLQPVFWDPMVPLEAN